MKILRSVTQSVTFMVILGGFVPLILKKGDRWGDTFTRKGDTLQGFVSGFKRLWSRELTRI